jgi:hypothetical protein
MPREAGPTHLKLPRSWRETRGAEASWLFQSLLGWQAGEAVARNRQVEQRISLPERAAGGYRFECHRLDRGQLGATRMVRFERSGPKVLLIQDNLDYRAVSNDPDERHGAQLFRGVRAVGFQGGCGGKGSCPGGRHAAEHSRQRVRTSSSRLGSGTNLAFSERSEADERHASG